MSEPQAPAAPRAALRGIAQVGLILLLAAGCYLNTLGNELVLDDRTVVGDPALNNPRAVLRWFASPYWRSPGTFAPAPDRPLLYRPLATVTFAVDRAWSGDRPLGYHVTNLVLHAAASLTLLLLLVVLLGAGPVPFAAAALFACHPVHTEAVAGIAYRPEVLATFLGLLSLLLYAAAALPPRLLAPSGPDPLPAAPRRSTPGLFAAALVLLLALLAKESAIAVPLLLAGLEFFALRRALPAVESPAAPPAQPWRPMVARLAVLAAVVALYFALRVHALGVFGAGPGAAIFENRSIPPANRVATLLRVGADYLRLLLVPFRLAADYPENTERSALLHGLDEPVVVACGLAVLMALVAPLALSRRRPDVAFFGLWVFAALLPASNLLVPLAVVKAERLLYLPSAGACVLLAIGLVRLTEIPRARWAARVAYSLGAVAVVAFAALTVLRNREWRDPVTLFSTLVAVQPANPRAELWLGQAYAERHDDDAAVRHLDRAAQLAPDWGEPRLARGIVFAALGQHYRALADYEAALPMAAHLPVDLWRARSLRALGRHAEALAALQQATAAQPADLEALRECVEEGLRGDMTEAEARARLAAWCRTAGREASPAEAELRLGLAYAAAGRAREALTCLDRVTPALAAKVPILTCRGEAFLALARFEEAEAAFAAALAAAPADPRALRGRGRARLARGADLPGAVADLAAAARAEPGGLECAQDLAIALLRSGRREEALREVERLRQAGIPPRAELVRALREAH